MCVPFLKIIEKKGQSINDIRKKRRRVNKYQTDLYKEIEIKHIRAKRKTAEFETPTKPDLF